MATDAGGRRSAKLGFDVRFPNPTVEGDGNVANAGVVGSNLAANRPGFPAPTIPRLFSALARKLMVCEVYSAGTTGLGRRTRK
jgi:hypothetical protein